MNMKLLHGNCIEEMANMDANSIDLTVTSPPYDNLRTYEGSLEWNENIWKQVLEQLYRVTKQGGVVVWVVGDATVKGSETGTSFKQAIFAKEIGFSVETMIWEKTGSGCLGSNSYYSQNFEYMFVFARGKPMRGELIKDRENKVKSGKISVNGGLVDGKGKIRVIELKPYGKRNNIWRYDPQKNSDHPAPYPIAMVADHIRSWSNEGDTVLDPFMGSGTTGVAAKELGRNFIGIEKVEKYFEIAKARVTAETQGNLKL